MAEGVLPPGTLVDHFRLMRPIARGGMGEVYLARDTSLGRRVALKIIRTEHEGSDEATRALLFEAKTIARFSHPNIVTVFAVGAYEGRPYLALEYLEGDNLEDRLGERRPSPSEAFRIAQSICDAVTEAHAHGVLHLDLKPANVIIPRDGRLRVLDFGLAKIVREVGHDDDGDQATVGWGTPAYTAPEQWRREPASAATDVWSLGVLLYELLSGRLPWEHPSPVVMGRAICSEEVAPRVSDVADVSPEAAELVAGCLSKDPEARPTAAEVGEALAELSGAAGAATMEESPFRGLMPFTSRHAGLFFGREPEIAAFVERARHHGVLPIVGPSGCGKSSFVQAGVIPRLREQGDWVVLRLRAGSRPFETLVDRLRRRDAPVAALQSDDDLDPAASISAPLASVSHHGIAESARITPVPGLLFDEDPEVVARQLRETPRKLSLLLRRLADETGRNVLLVVEQLEQVLTLVEDARTRRRFVSALCTAADDALEPVRVIFTLRDEALGRIASGPEVRDALANMTVLQTLDDRALQRALSAPVTSMGYRYEDPALVDRMSDAVRGQPGSLPLLQFAAQKLWERRDTERRVLLTATYEAMGGVEGALAQHAEEVIDGLSDAERGVARRLLVRLATEDRGRHAQSASRVKEGLGDDVDDVVDRLAQSRVITMTRGREHGPRVALAHESLATRWPTLVRWLDEARGDALFLGEARPAAELWERRGRRPEELWRGDALRDASRRRARLRADPPPIVDDFLLAGQHRELRRQRRKRVSLIVVVSASLLVAAGAAGAALMIADREEDAVAARDQAQHQRAVALREAATAAARSGNVLEARAKLRVALTEEDAPLARALWRDLRDDPRLWHHPLGSLVHQVAFSPDGASVAAACQDMAIYVIDVVTRRVDILRGSNDQVNAVAWSPDSQVLVSGSWSGEVSWWSRSDGGTLRTVAAHEGSVLDVEYSPDGRFVASAGADGVVHTWDATTGKASGTYAIATTASALAYSPDGQRLAAATSNGVQVWAPTDPKWRQRLGEGPVGSLAYSADGQWIAAGFDSGVAKVWTAAQGTSVATLHGHSAEVSGVHFDGTGERLITASSDKTVRLWRVSNGEVLRILPAHAAGVTALDLGPEGQHLVTSSRDRSVALWDLQRQRERADDRGHTAGVYRVVFAPDGATVASASGDQTVRLWDVATGEQTAVLAGHAEGVDSVAISPDGQLLASGSVDHSVRLWDLESATVRKVLHGHGGRIWDVAFSADGTLLASAGRDGVVRVWDVASGTEVATLAEHDGGVYGVAFSADGRALASAGADGTVRVWPRPGFGPSRVLTGHEGAVYGLGFGGEDRWLATAGADKTVGIWDLQQGGSRTLGPHGGRVYWLDVDRAGVHVAAPASDGDVTIWSVPGQRRITTLHGHRDEANGAAFSPDGSLVATAADDHTVRLWDVEHGRPFWRAPIMQLDPPVIYSHEGWVPLDPAAVAEVPRAAAWTEAVELRVRRGDYHRDGHACVATHDDALELWSVADGQRRAAAPLRHVTDVRAAADGCLALAGQQAVWLPAQGTLETLSTPSVATAIGLADGAGQGHLLVATSGEVVDIVPGPGTRTSTEVEPGVTAMAQAGDVLVLGFRDGHLSFEPSASSTAADTRTAEGAPASAVERIVASPQGVVAAGFANGEVGMWSVASGRRLAKGRLHGRVAHLAVDGAFLFAATDLGHVLRWDLDVLLDDYCTVLREVWDRVPVVWADGRVVVEPPPRDHGCIAED
ncbi:MAG: protein kinase [Myxococcota bacterium]